MAFLWLPSKNGEKKQELPAKNLVARENSASLPDVPYRSRLYLTSLRSLLAPQSGSEYMKISVLLSTHKLHNPGPVIT